MFHREYGKVGVFPGAREGLEVPLEPLLQNIERCWHARIFTQRRVNRREVSQNASGLFFARACVQQMQDVDVRP